MSQNFRLSPNLGERFFTMDLAKRYRSDDSASHKDPGVLHLQPVEG